MPPLTGEELASVCRAADAETVAGFVADLQEARGRTVQWEGGPAFTLGAGSDHECVVVPDGRTVPTDADVVVTAGRPVDPGAVDAGRVFDADTLRDALAYAVDRATADRLLRQWFDRPLSSFEGASGTLDAGDASSPDDDPAGTVRSSPRLVDEAKGAQGVIALK